MLVNIYLNFTYTITAASTGHQTIRRGSNKGIFNNLDSSTLKLSRLTDDTITVSTKDLATWFSNDPGGQRLLAQFLGMVNLHYYMHSITLVQ